MLSIEKVFDQAAKEGLEEARRAREAAGEVARAHRKVRNNGDDVVRYKITCWSHTAPYFRESRITRSPMSLTDAIDKAEQKFFDRRGYSSNRREVIVIIDGTYELVLTDDQIYALEDED